MTAKRPLWPMLLASALAFALLCSLGVWQLQRLEQKQALIATVDARMQALPVDLAQALAGGDDIEYLRVRAEGRYLPSAPLRKIGVHQNGPGQELLHPFFTNDGIFVLVNRGTVVAGDTDPAIIPPAQSIIIDGVLRRHTAGQGLFDPDNDQTGNNWIWWDVPAMIAATNPPAAAQVATFVLHLVPSPGLPAKPFVPAPKAELRNNHLGYAITWFGLALALLGVTAVAAWRSRG